MDASGSNEAPEEEKVQEPEPPPETASAPFLPVEKKPDMDFELEEDDFKGSLVTNAAVGLFVVANIIAVIFPGSMPWQH